MINETFYLRGEDAREYGIRLQKPLEFTAATPSTETKHIAGRNGDVVSATGAYKNRQGTASCFALQEDVMQIIGDINGFLFQNHGYMRLQGSDDLEHFWMARVTNGARIEQRMRMLAPFEIKFDCKPQRFLVSGETPYAFESPSFIVNPTRFNSKPLIVVYGTGPGTVTVGNKTVDIKALEDMIILDSESENAYRQVGDAAAENKNSTIYAPEFPELVPGENPVTWDGDITSVLVTPRWWTL